MNRLLVACAVLLIPCVARAADKSVCQTDYEGGQVARSAGKLRSALAQFRQCSQDPCPEFIKADCAQWASQVAADIPTIVIAARDANGADVAAVRVLVDGELRTDHLTGTPMEVDPGEHVLRFVRTDAPAGAVEQRVLFRVGEHERAIAVMFPAAAKLAAPPATRHVIASRPMPVTAYVFGALTLASAGVFATAAIVGKVHENDLASTCGRPCPEDRIDSVTAAYRVADIALVASAVFAATTAVFVLTRPTVNRSVAIEVGPGGVAVLGRF